MYNVSNAYKIAAMEPAQEHRLTGTIGSVSFDEENIVAGTFNIQKQSTDSNSMVLGSCYVGQLTATFTNIGIARGAWIGKVITPTFALKLANNSWESVPLGVYKIKEAVHTAEGVQVTAYDNMIKFDKKIKNKKNTLGIKSDSMWTFIDLCCTKCNVILGMTKAEIDALPNGYRQQNDIEIYGDAKADDFANDIETYRDLLFWCAQTVGCFATMDRAGQLILRQYTQLWDETISDSVRLSGAHFEDYVTHFTGILVTDMDTNDDTYYGYDADELLVQINETSEDLTTANEALTGNLEEQADLERRHDAHEITDEQYYAEKALLKELEKIYRTNVKRLEKRLGWLEAELHDAQNDEEGAIMDLGANPFVQYKNLTKRDNTRRRILGAMDDISYTPFTASMVCGAHYDLGDVICFTGGHSDNDICCVMSWSYTHNMGTELEGFGTDSAQQQVRVKNKAEKQADRANTTASTTGHTYVAEADPDTTTGAPRSSKNGDIWVEMNEEPGPMQPGMPFVTKRDYAGWGAANPSLDETDGSYSIAFAGSNTSYEHIDVLNEDTVVLSFGNALQGERTTYSVSMDVLWSNGTADGTWMRQLGFIFANEPRAYSYAGWGETPPAGFFVDSDGDNGTAHIQFNADHTRTQHFEGEFECLSTDGKIYMTLLRSMTREEHPGDPPYGNGMFLVSHLIISREGAEPSPGEPTRYVGKQYANDNGTWREVERIAGVDTSSDAGTDGDNGLSITQTRSQLRLKPNVMRALYKADPPQQGVNFSRFCVRYTGEPDKDIAIEPFANHTFSNIKVDADNENAFKIRCGGVGGSGSYAVYKITGLVVDAPYFFNFAYNFSDNASFGDNFTKGLGLVFNTTGTISTDSWSGEADTFDEETLYYSMYRSTTKHYADFDFKATATTMYMCVVLADETGGQDITLTLNEFVIANSERKLIRNIYLYDYNKNVWLKYRPFGSVTGGSDDGGGSQVEITPTISTGTKIADYSIDGVAGELFAPQGGSGDVDAIEITYAEYQLLTPEEKADPDKIYFVTDYPSGGGSDVEINPSDPATDIATKIKVDGTVYVFEDVDAVHSADIGVSVASLENGKVPSSQLPSYVDDVLEYASLSAFPVTGESGKIYIALDTNKTYRWSGSAYVEISASLVLGTTHSTAAYGDDAVSTAQPTYSEASTRTNLSGSGEGLLAIFGKIKKWFSDLKDLAFVAIDGVSSTKYLRGDGTWQAFPTIPTVNNGTLTIKQNGTTKATFTANQSGNSEADITVPDVTEVDTTNTTPYLYRASQATGDRLYDKLIGCSFGVNQLVQNGDFANGETNWSFASVTLHSVSNSVETFTASAQYGRMYQSLGTKKLIKDHVFLFSADLKIASGTRRIQMCISDAVVGTQTILKTINSNWVRYYWLAKVTYTFTGTESIIIRDYESSNFVGISVRKVNYTDLTQMFGTSIADKAYTMEQSTAGSGIAWLQSYGFFTKDYYPYNTGSLVSVKPTAHKMVEKNLFDKSATNASNGFIEGKYLDNTGVAYSSSNYNVSEYIKIPNVQYISFSGGAGTNPAICFYDSSKAFISGVKWNERTSFAATRPSNAVYVRVSYAKANADIVQVEQGVATTYDPYTEHSYPLNTELRGVPTLSGNDIVYDGDVENADGSVERKYIFYNLGEYAWTRIATAVSGSYRFSHSFGNIKQSDTSYGVKSICSKYVVLANGGTYSTNHTGYTITTSGEIIIYDDALKNATEAQFKTAMSGIYLVAELAAPTTESSTPFDNPQICDPNGTEEYVDTRDVPIPVGHTTKYVNLPDWMEEGYIADLRNRVDEHIGSDGNFNGNALTATLATKAIQDGDGNTISSTYLKLSGGTLTGKLTGTEFEGFLTSNYLKLGEAGSVQGLIRFFNAGGYKVSLYSYNGDLTADRDVRLPNASGILTVSGSSSIKTKKNVTDMTDAEAEKLLSLRPVNYDYKNEDNGTDCYGLIAEEVQEAGIDYPVFTMHDNDLDEDVPALDYAKFVPYLIKMVQKQQKQIDTMQKQINELMERIKWQE